jgi:hypothetical protein
MKVIIHFPTLKGILDEHGKLTQERTVLVDWLNSQLGPESISPTPRGYVIQQVLDDEPIIVSLPKDWTEEQIKQFESRWYGLMTGSKLTFIPDQPEI